MNFNLAAVAVSVALSITNAFSAKMDTVPTFCFSNQIDKSTMITDAVWDTKGNVIPMSDKAETIVTVIEKEPHPLDDLLQAIIYVESKGNEKAYNKNGDCVGILQITKICVRECNRVLKKNGSDKRYTYADRWNKEKSIEMFYLLQDEYNPNYDIVKGIRIWNKGDIYKNKVLKRLNKK